MHFYFSAPPQMNSQMNSSPVPFNLNGGVDMQNFLGLLEHEEADFVEQVKKSKAFIQKIIKAELKRIVNMAQIPNTEYIRF